jgi:hypothetical protein
MPVESVVTGTSTEDVAAAHGLEQATLSQNVLGMTELNFSGLHRLFHLKKLKLR